MSSTFRIATLVLAIGSGAFGQLYVNGPIVTHVGAGAGGSDVSALDTGAALNIFGFGAQVLNNNRVADDFVIPCGQIWHVGTISTYAYQTGSTTTPTITAANYRIWNGAPNAGGVVLYDYSSSNQMTAVTFSNVYRALITTLTDAQRPIMQVDLAGNGMVLGPGTYWLDVEFNGSLASGPWAPPIAILGTPATGNGLQSLAGVWGTLLDGSFLQGLPFKIAYTLVTSPCFHLDITQAGGPGTPVTIADTTGAPFTTGFNVITLNQGAFPNGWLFGVDLPFTELHSIIVFGLPFVATLDATGGFSFTVGVTLPFPVTLYYVGIDLSGASLMAIDSAKTVTIS